MLVKFSDGLLNTAEMCACTQMGDQVWGINLQVKRFIQNHDEGEFPDPGQLLRVEVSC